MFRVIAALAVVLGVSEVALCAQHTLGLDDGFKNFTTPDFAFSIVSDSQTAYSLRPISETNDFDFIPYDEMSKRDSDGQYHLGDISFRARTVGSSAWQAGDSSTARKVLTALNITDANTLAAADLDPTLPSTSLLNITRRWVLNDGHLQLLFEVANRQETSVEIGSLGAALEFNNIFTDRTTSDTNNNCSFFDPYIGLNAGYVQVTPLLGTLPPLVVTPVGDSPFEGWVFLDEETSTDPFYQSQTFEGLYAWHFHTLAFAENEWENVTPWNNATSAILEPGQTRTYGLQFDLVPSIREIENTVTSLGRPLAVGIPGYVIPQDQTAKLFISYGPEVSTMSVEPAGALSWSINSDSLNASWSGYDIVPSAWGRSRLTITYADGAQQTVQYFVTHAAVQAISDLGNFLTTEAWFNDPSDPFHRSPSVISYDRSVNGPVKDDARAWIPGLEDEAGAGNWIAASVKQFVQPTAVEAAKMELFINSTLWGSIQNISAPVAFKVKHSVYFYQPDLVANYTYPSTIDWGNWWSWNEASSYALDRAYDYVHVTAAYWALYRVSRNYNETVPMTQTWEWYLSQAFNTVMAMTDGTVGYANDGLMEETVLLYLLNDLRREGFTSNFTAMESRMSARHDIWSTERFPFGSEMAWDSTGQEGVYLWSKYFNDTATATNVVNSILAYDPTVAHWGYNGNARRYWDNIYGGKLMRIERQIHHYGSGLNALPLMSQFESNPADIYLLRVAYGGLSGPLTNIDEGGFASASFHSFADTLAWDAYSGDYGPNFVGHALNSGAYLIQHPDFGWQVFGGSVTSRKNASIVEVQVLDSVRRKVFIAPIAAKFTLDAGAFDSFTFDTTSNEVTLTILPAPRGIANAALAARGRILVESTVGGSPILEPSVSLDVDAGAFTVPFTNGSATIVFTAK